jgi:hypothetical protein
MSLIRSWKDFSGHAAGGPWDATTADAIAANFPCVELFFPCNEAAASAVLTDIVQGATLSVASLTRTADGFGIKTTSGAKNTTGTDIALDSPFMYFVVGDGSAFPPSSFGAATGVVINLATAAPFILGPASAYQATGTAFTLHYGRANVLSAFNTSTGQTTYQCNITDTSTALANTPTDATSAGGVALTDPLDDLIFGASGWNPAGTGGIYGIMFAKFTTIPTNILSILAWQTYQWANGNKWICPALKGVS